MPELPEVEVVRRNLSEALEGKTVVDFEIVSQKSLTCHDNCNISQIKGQKLLKFDRYAKYLVLRLDNNEIVLHLRMEGKFSVGKELIIENSTIAWWKFSSNEYLMFSDFRRFATVDIYNHADNIRDLKQLLNVGPEPNKVVVKTLFDEISKKNSPIKSVLLDQKYIAGLGNIYVDEVLYACGVSPFRKARDTNIDEMKCIVHQSIIIMNASIKVGGTSKQTFSSLGIKGQYQNYLKVHNNKGGSCGPNKEFTIIKDKIGGRGTYWCEGYQK